MTTMAVPIHPHIPHAESGMPLQTASMRTERGIVRGYAMATTTADATTQATPFMASTKAERKQEARIAGIADDGGNSSQLHCCLVQCSLFNLNLNQLQLDVMVNPLSTVFSPKNVPPPPIIGTLHRVHNQSSPRTPPCHSALFTCVDIKTKTHGTRLA